MSEDGREVRDDDEIAREALARATPKLVYVTRPKLRRKGRRRSFDWQGGSLPATPEGLAEVVRVMRGARHDRGTGTIVTDDEIRRLVAELRTNHRRVTLKAIATASGTFTRDNLRYYLLANGRRLRDYLD